jgi:hypothetical protein
VANLDDSVQAKQNHHLVPTATLPVEFGEMGLMKTPYPTVLYKSEFSA